MDGKTYINQGLYQLPHLSPATISFTNLISTLVNSKNISPKA
jgi:hypothetical protein